MTVHKVIHIVIILVRGFVLQLVKGTVKSLEMICPHPTIPHPTVGGVIWNGAATFRKE